MKINTSNTEAMVEAISEAEGKARVRCLDVERIASAVKAAERRLDDMSVPPAARKDCYVHLSPEKVANSYRGVAEGTFATITRGTKDWFLTSVSRRPCGNCPYGGGSRRRLNLSESAMSAIPNVVDI